LENLTKIEKEFKEFISFLKRIGYKDMPQILKTIKVQEIPKEYHRCFKFWTTLSGPSRNFMIDISEDKKTNKIFAKDDRKIRIKSTLREKRVDYPFPEMK